MVHPRFLALLLVASSLGSITRADDPPASNPDTPPEKKEVMIALEGFDAVSYQNSEKPLMGNEAHAFEWEGLTWYFATDANREAFIKDPGAFAPQYESDCACVVATEGRRVKGDPKIFRIIDGKLYFFHDAEKRALWDKNPADFIRKGDEKALTLYRVRF